MMIMPTRTTSTPPHIIFLSSHSDVGRSVCVFLVARSFVHSAPLATQALQKEKEKAKDDAKKHVDVVIQIGAAEQANRGKRQTKTCDQIGSAISATQNN